VSDSSSAHQMVRIHLLGELRVVIGDQITSDAMWRHRPSRSLLRGLALAPNHRLSRDQALNLVGRAESPEAEVRALYRALHTIRRVLEPENPGMAKSSLLSFEGGVLRLCPSQRLWVDVEEFEARARRARLSREVQDYEAALAVFGGELLLEDGVSDPHASRASALHTLHGTLLMELADAHFRRGDLNEAILTLHRLIVTHPTWEDAHRALMRLYIFTGRRYEAEYQYQQLQDILHRELGAAPDAETEQIYADMRRSQSGQPSSPVSPARDHQQEGEPAHSATPLPTGTQRAHGSTGSSQPQLTPASYTTSFIGRRGELALVADLLEDARLLTIWGMAGCGKTRLALQSASELSHAYRDGMRIVLLAPLTDPQMLPAAVADQLGVREESGQGALATLVEAMSTRDMLLVLDNCEHLRAACAELVAELIAHCPHVHLLATSRAPLGLTDTECVWRLPSLETPDPEHLPPLHDLLSYDAIRLFVERAALARPGIALTPRNARAIVQICWRLGGIPLAIELAAGCVRFMTPAQIAARLDDCFAVLNGSGPVVLPRQQTMRMAIDWSWRLLDDHDQVLLRRLAVFSGSWPLEAAEAICADDGLPRGEIPRLLGRLVDHALVDVEDHGERMRYRMVEVIRQFAQEQLQSSEEAETLRRRHVEWYVDLAEEAAPHLRGPDRREHMDRLAAELDNLRAALQQSFDSGWTTLALPLSSALGWFWYTRGLMTEGRRWLTPLVALEDNRVEASAQPTLARALYAAGWLAYVQGDLEEAEALSERSRTLFGRLGDKRGLAEAINVQGCVAGTRNQLERADAAFQECLRLATECGDTSRMAISLSNLADMASQRGDVNGAAVLYGRCLELAREAADERSIAMSLTNLGRIAHVRGDDRRAIDYLNESADRFRTLGDVRGIGEALATRATVLRDSHDAEGAVQAYAEALELFERAGMRTLIAECLDGLAEVLAARKQYSLAAEVLSMRNALHHLLGSEPTPAEQERHGRLVLQVRGILGLRAFERALVEGRALTVERLIARVGTEERPHEPAPAPRSRGRPRAADNAGRPSLPPGERKVAELVARGLTNWQIAERLQRSQRTIETQVSNILAHTGLRSRKELAMWLAAQREDTAGD
jgi:predicted ATPase/DNA-binding SARP family transcriptional activator/DNA-binding CsgD family transcriptional regulator